MHSPRATHHADIPATETRRRRATARQLQQAAVNGDEQACTELLDTLAEPLPSRLIQPAAIAALAARRYRQAADLFGRCPDQSDNDRLGRFAANLAALQEHRPDVLRTLHDTPDGHGVHIVEQPGVDPTLHIEANDRQMPLSIKNDPAQTIATLWPQLDQPRKTADAVMLLGIGDGYLLDKLAAEPEPLLFNQKQLVVLVEMNIDVLRGCLMLHDWSQDDSPITDPRFVWIVSADQVQVTQQLTEELVEKRVLAPPAYVVRQTVNARPMLDAVAACGQAYQRQFDALGEQLDTHYSDVSSQQLAAMFGDDPPRQPRILLCTSRFTSVLQYATADTSRAMRSIGWDTRILIEDTDWRKFSPLAYRQVLAQYKPDAVFFIDHLSREFGRTIPKQVPALTWIQDELPHLTDTASGESIGQRDFVLSGCCTMYVKQFAYPRDQCIDLEKVTHLPQHLPVTEKPCDDRPDVLYVSNASQEPSRVAEELIALAHAQAPQTSTMVECACSAIIETYAQGQTIYTHQAIEKLLVQIMANCQLTAPPEAVTRHALTLHNRLNNALYRQQALRWVAQACDDMGLRLELRGRGWDQHPDFAAYDRGPIAYGPDLEQRTRQAQINLQIVPCSNVHQRLLDGIAAGGFYLIRSHPIDAIYAGLIDLMQRHDAVDARSITELSERITPGDQPRLDTLAQQFDQTFTSIGHQYDPVDALTYLARSDSLDRLSGLPHEQDVSFTDQATTQRLIERFIGDDSARAAIVAAQFDFVKAHYGAQANWRRVFKHVGQRLAATTDASSAVTRSAA